MTSKETDLPAADETTSGLQIIFDANALITACKFAVDQDVVIDRLSQACWIHVPESVAKEATQNARHPDARVADNGSRMA